MPYCPQCQTEYVEGTDRCADCNVTLVDALPVPDTDAPTPGTQFVALRSYPSLIHAEMVAAALADAGIERMVRSNEMFGAGTGLGSLAPTRVEIWVPADKLDAARDIADSTLDPT
jgi:hypothetical protein